MGIKAFDSNGRKITEVDYPHDAVVLAMRRIEVARKAGRVPADDDLATLLEFLEEQELKYPTTSS